MRHASKYIQANFEKLEQDLEVFAERRLYVSAKLQKWFAIHQIESSWDTKYPCLSCLLLFNKIDRLYFAACANIRYMMAVLEKGLRASALLFKATHKHVAGQTQDQTLGEFCAPLLQNLESTERMLQALEDDAEKRKGWPQASLSEQHSVTASRPEKDEDQENYSEGDNTKTEVNADTAAITDPRSTRSSAINFSILNTSLAFAGFKMYDHHWIHIGRFSRSLGHIEGTLASHRLKEEVEPRVYALPQDSLEYFKAVAQQHEACTIGLAFSPEELRACLPNVFSDRTGQEAANTALAVEAPTGSNSGPGDTEIADGDQDANTDGAKLKQVKSKKSKSKKQKKGRR